MATLLTANALISSSLVTDIPRVPSIPGALHGTHMLLHPWESRPETPLLRPGGAAAGQLEICLAPEPTLTSDAQAHPIADKHFQNG